MMMPKMADGQEMRSVPARGVRARLKRLAKRAVVIAVTAYVLLCVLLYAGQRWLVFPGSCTPVAAGRYTPPPGSTPLTLHTNDGTQIAGLFCRAFDEAARPVDRPADYPTIIYTYGNGQVAAWSLFEVDLFRRCGANVLVADYPGYGLSMGKPSEEGCYQTAEALWKYAMQSNEVDHDRLVAVGWSLGGAMAIDLASHHRVQGLMTSSAFTRIKQVAQRRFWFVPAALLLRYDFPSADKLPGIDCPTLIMHGDADNLVPYSMSEDLMAISPAKWKRHVRVAGAGHNDVFSTGYEPIRNALKELLDKVNADAAAQRTQR